MRLATPWPNGHCHGEVAAIVAKSTCVDVVRDEQGAVVELHCTYDPESRGGATPDGYLGGPSPCATGGSGQRGVIRAGATRLTRRQLDAASAATSGRETLYVWGFMKTT